MCVLWMAELKSSMLWCNADPVHLFTTFHIPAGWSFSPLVSHCSLFPWWHFSISFLDYIFLDRWRGWRGHISWPRRSPDLITLEYFQWETKKWCYERASYCSPEESHHSSGGICNLRCHAAYVWWQVRATNGASNKGPSCIQMLRFMHSYVSWKTLWHSWYSLCLHHFIKKTIRRKNSFLSTGTSTTY